MASQQFPELQQGSIETQGKISLCICVCERQYCILMYKSVLSLTDAFIHLFIVYLLRLPSLQNIFSKLETCFISLQHYSREARTKMKQREHLLLTGCLIFLECILTLEMLGRQLMIRVCTDQEPSNREPFIH